MSIIYNPPLNETIYLNSTGNPYPEVIQKAFRLATASARLRLIARAFALLNARPGANAFIWLKSTHDLALMDE